MTRISFIMRSLPQVTCCHFSWHLEESLEWVLGRCKTLTDHWSLLLQQRKLLLHRQVSYEVQQALHWFLCQPVNHVTNCTIYNLAVSASSNDYWIHGLVVINAISHITASDCVLLVRIRHELCQLMKNGLQFLQIEPYKFEKFLLSCNTW